MSSFVKASGSITPNSADPGEEFPFLHTITVVDRVVSVDKPELVQNNINTETVTLNLDSEWEGLSTVINIGNDEPPTSLIWSGQPVVIPAELMTDVGALNVSVVGYGDDGAVRSVTKKADAKFTVVASGYVEDDVPVPDPTTLLGQLIQAADNANQAADRFNQASEDIEGIGPAIEKVQASEANAKQSETNAAASAESASRSASTASTSAEAARTSETNAAASATAASQSATAAASSAQVASETNADIKDMIRFGNSISIFSIDQRIPLDQRLIPYQVKSGRIYRIYLLDVYDGNPAVNIYVDGHSDTYVSIYESVSKASFKPKNDGILRFYPLPESSGSFRIGILDITDTDFIRNEKDSIDVTLNFQTKESVMIPAFWIEKDASYDITNDSDIALNIGTAYKFANNHIEVAGKASVAVSFGVSSFLYVYPLNDGEYPIDSVTIHVKKRREEDNVYHIGSDFGNPSFSNFINSIKDDDSEKTVYIHQGVYDIYSELGGAEYINSLPSDSKWRDVQPIIPPNTKIIGAGNVTLRFMVDDGQINEEKKSLVNLFSPVNVSGSCTIENISIEAKNCRYCIHDETSGNAIFDGAVHNFIGVRAHMYNGSLGHGGCYYAGHNNGMSFLFDNCSFESEKTFSWSTHDWTTSAKNYDGAIYILKNCRFPQGFRLSSSSKKDNIIDRVYLNGCYLSKLAFSAENPGEYYQRYKVSANLCNAFKVEYSDYIVYGKEDPVIFNSIG